MTSRKKWPLLITLFLILGLLLVACERPLPGDGSDDAPAPATPAEPDPGTYPGPGADDTSAYPGQSAADPDSGESSYPAPDAELIQPADENNAAAEDETAEGETAESDTAEDETAEGETAEGDTAEGETAEGETAEGDAAEGDAAEGDAAEEQTGERTHTVATGDNLFRIGMQYGVSWVTIAQVNNITNPESLTIGQVLIIPEISDTDTTEATVDSGDSDAAETAESTETVETSESTETEETAPPEAAASETIYVVQSGDNLYRISLKFGVNMMDVARANDLANFDDIAVGQELVIPGAEAAETEAEVEEVAAEEITHEVLEGETVFGIAFKYGISWTKLVDKNNISSPYSLETGQILVIPSDE